MKPVIGIIGGRGKTGSQFAKIFRNKGFKVLIGSRKGLSYEECARRSDIVIVSVPIAVTVNIINKIAKLVKRNGLLADFTSIKGPACKAMKKAKSEVIGMHPMFGPDIKSLKGQVIVLCPVKSRKWLPFINKVFKEADLKICSPEEHDKIVAFVQCLIHFHLLALAKTLKDLKFDVKESLEYSTPIYRIETALLGRILSQNPELYADIQMENPIFLKVLNTFEKEVKELKRIVRSKDKNKFIKYFDQASKHFNSIKAKSMKESKYIIKKMAEKK